MCNILLESSWKKQLGITEFGWEVDFKMHPKEIRWGGCELNSLISEWQQTAGCCEEDIEPQGSKKTHGNS
jgi:hypothetical protein